MDDPGIRFCGFLGAPREAKSTDKVKCDAVVFHLESGSVPAEKIQEVATCVARKLDCECFVAGIDCKSTSEGNLHFEKRFDFEKLLPHAAVFVNHGGQNSVMDALRFGIPQVIYPGKVFERQYNA